MKSLLDIPEHSLVLQRLVSIVGPEQGLPPWVALVFTVRLLLCIPPPQEALHSVHRPYSPHSQLTNFNFQYKLHAKKFIHTLWSIGQKNFYAHLYPPQTHQGVFLDRFDVLSNIRADFNFSSKIAWFFIGLTVFIAFL